MDFHNRASSYKSGGRYSLHRPAARYIAGVTYGISRSGANAEERFIQLTGALPARRASDGDAVLDGHLVEIKAASSNTLNQVRATKFITLVAFDTRTTDWYVVPAHEVVRLVSGKQRGQHTENPFESATLSVANLQMFRLASEDQLREAVLDAAAASAEFPEVRDAMQFVLDESRCLAEESRARVAAAFSRGPRR